MVYMECKIRISSIGIMAAVMVAASTVSVSVRAADTPQAHDADTILKIEHDWIVASQCGDNAFVSALLADDYQDLSYDSPGAVAKVSGRADSLQGPSRVKADCMQHLPRQEDVHVELHGDTAIASGMAVLPPNKIRPERRFHFLDVYLYSGGRWQAVFSEDISL
jgi:hypothetical protein